MRRAIAMDSLGKWIYVKPFCVWVSSLFTVLTANVFRLVLFSVFHLDAHTDVLRCQNIRLATEHEKKKLCASKQPSDVRVHKHKIWIFDSYFGFRFGFDFDFGFAHWYSGPLVFHSMWMYVVCWLCPSVARSNRTDVSCVCACVALDYGDRPKANNVHNHCGIIIYAA